MRLTLDLLRNLVLALPSDSEPPNPARISLGDGPITLVVSADQPLAPLFDEDDTLDVPAEVEFMARAALGGAEILNGSASIETAPPDADDTTLQEFTLGEDYASAVLVALFEADTTYVDLKAQWRWRHGADPEAAWESTPWITLRVWNCLFPSDLIPGGVTLGSDIYVTSINDYTGGGATKLDGLATVSLPVGTIVRIVTANGESAWEVQAGTTATNVAEGIVKPVDHHAVTNAKIFARISGL